MLITDIKKLQKYKTLLNEQPNNCKKIEKKITKIENKYQFIKDVGNGIQAVYWDKYKSKVVVMDNGEVKQIGGPLLHPHFISYMIAYLILIGVAIPIMLMGLINPDLEPISNSISFVIGPAAIVLNIMTLIQCRETIKKNKWLIVLLAFTLCINISSIIF